MSLLIYLALGALAVIVFVGLSTDVRAAVRRLFRPRRRQSANRRRHPGPWTTGSTWRTTLRPDFRQTWPSRRTRRAIPPASAWGLPGVEGAEPPASPFVPTRGRLACRP